MNATEPLAQDLNASGLGLSSNILGKDDFLRILVTQLRNQNPLNPMRSEEFAAQLAQFSSVEQLQNINSSLSRSIETNLLLNQSINNVLATTLIGRQVQALGNRVRLNEGESVALNFRLAAPAESVTVRIRDEAGRVVRTVEISGRPEGAQSYTWDGKDDAGNELPDGDYTFSVNAVDGDGNSVAATTFITGVISGIRYENGNAILRVGDYDVNMADVFQIGAASGEDEE